MRNECLGVLLALLAAALPAGCTMVDGPVTTSGGLTLDSKDQRATLTCDQTPEPGPDWPQPTGRAMAYIRFDHSQWLAISTAYRTGQSEYRLLLIGPNAAWSIEFDYHEQQSGLARALAGPSTLAMDVVDALAHSSPDARSLMDASTAALVRRMDAGGTMPVEYIEKGGQSLSGTLTFARSANARDATSTTRPASQPVSLDVTMQDIAQAIVNARPGQRPATQTYHVQLTPGRPYAPIILRVDGATTRPAGTQ